MARARNIKPSICSNEDLADLSPYARLAFIYSWMFADYRGVLEFRPGRLKINLLPFDDVDIEGLFRSLEQSGFCRIFEVGGTRYLKLLKFVEHQNPHKKERESGTKYPDLTDVEVIKNQQFDLDPVQTGTSTELAVPLPSSLFPLPDSPIPRAREPVPVPKPNPSEDWDWPLKPLIDAFPDYLPDRLTPAMIGFIQGAVSPDDPVTREAWTAAILDYQMNFNPELKRYLPDKTANLLSVFRSHKCRIEKAVGDNRKSVIEKLPSVAELLAEEENRPALFRPPKTKELVAN